jgi:hypothetical protein
MRKSQFVYDFLKKLKVWQLKILFESVAFWNFFETRAISSKTRA